MPNALILTLLLTLPAVLARAEVVGREGADGTLLLQNDHLRLTFSRQTGQMISMISRGQGDAPDLELCSGRESFYWDANLEPRAIPEGVEPHRKGYWRPGWESMELIHTGPTTPDRAELLLIAEPDEWSNFRSEVRYTLFEGDSGFYMTARLIHPSDQPAARLWQTRFVSGADEPEDFTQSGVTVAANETNDVGTLAWMPDRRGETLWQIGTFDRSAGEFADGDDARRYEMFRRYPQLFPNDLTFTIGESDPKTDWNYAHWTWYSQRPEWIITFDLPNAHHTPDAEAEASDSGSEKDPKLPLRRQGEGGGGGMLTFGIASAQPLEGNRTELRVAVNGEEIGAIELPKTGTSGYRGGAQDSQYHVIRLEVPAKLLKKGENVVTLRHADARPFPTEGENVKGVGGSRSGKSCMTQFASI